MLLAAAAVGWCSARHVPVNGVGSPRARRCPRHGLINVRATHTISLMVSASVGHGSGATAGLSLVGFHPRSHLTARFGMRLPFVRTT